MANSYFRFKQFTVFHDRCAMKVGTDGVLLGAWCNTTQAKKILDIGTGSGLIALMVAQRSPTKIEAIEIDKDAFQQACENIKRSPFSEQITVIHADLASFAQAHQNDYDLIVCNPPYFVNSLKCPDQQRNTARHTDTLTLHDLVNTAARLLNSTGILALILPYDQNEILLKEAREADLHLLRETIIYPTPAASPKRILAEFSHREMEEPIRTTLTIEILRHQYTEEYKNLTKDFYLKM